MLVPFSALNQGKGLIRILNPGGTVFFSNKGNNICLWKSKTYSSVDTPNPETENHLYVFCLYILIFKLKYVRFEQVKTNNKFREIFEIYSGFVHSGLGIRYNKQITELFQKI